MSPVDVRVRLRELANTIPATTFEAAELFTEARFQMAVALDELNRLEQEIRSIREGWIECPVCNVLIQVPR